MPNKKQNEQHNKKKERYLDYILQGLKPNYLQLKAQKQLMECPNATRNDFSTHNVQEDVMLQVCSNFLHDLERIKFELATMRQEKRKLRTELREHRVNCMKGNFKAWAPTQKGQEKLYGSVIIVVRTDTLQIGVAKTFETKKYEKCNAICP